MGFAEKGDGIILLLLLASGVTNLLSILPKLRRSLVKVKYWLQSRSKKGVYHSIK